MLRPTCTALALSASLLAARPLPALAAAVYEVELELQIHDRTTGELVPFEPPYPNNYGQNMDLLIRVQVRQVAGDIAAWPPPDLTLTATAPGYDYPATGPVPPLEETYQQPLELYRLEQTYHFLFLMPYRCYFETELVASLPGAEQRRTIDLGCAE